MLVLGSAGNDLPMRFCRFCAPEAEPREQTVPYGGAMERGSLVLRKSRLGHFAELGIAIDGNEIAPQLFGRQCRRSRSGERIKHDAVGRARCIDAGLDQFLWIDCKMSFAKLRQRN